MDDTGAHEPTPPDPAERRRESAEDPVAASRAVERAAARLLTSNDLDEATRREIRVACEQLVADRTNGESLDGSTRRLRELLDRPNT